MSAIDTVIELMYEILSWIPEAGKQNAPTTVPGVTAPTPSPVVPAGPQLVDAVAKVIYAYNTSRTYLQVAASYTVVAKGVIIHKITIEEANQISVVLQAACKQYDIPIQFALACIAEESVFDPFCQNGNLGPGESNTANDPLGYDMGPCQEKLRYLIGFNGIKTAQDADNFALNVTKAIPYFCSIMAGKYEDAQKLIAKTAALASPKPDPRLTDDPWLLATGMYNFGETGMTLNYYNKGLFPSHCQQVLDLTAYFEKALGITPSMFPPLAS